MQQSPSGKAVYLPLPAATGQKRGGDADDIPAFLVYCESQGQYKFKSNPASTPQSTQRARWPDLRWLSLIILPLTSRARGNAGQRSSGDASWCQAAHLLVQEYAMRCGWPAPEDLTPSLPLFSSRVQLSRLLKLGIDQAILLICLPQLFNLASSQVFFSPIQTATLSTF